MCAEERNLQKEKWEKWKKKLEEKWRDKKKEQRVFVSRCGVDAGLNVVVDWDYCHEPKPVGTVESVAGSGSTQTTSCVGAPLVSASSC